MAEKYLVVVDKLELKLKQMRSEGKTKLPSEQDLCTEYSCSRQTVRAALEVLLQKGLIVKRAGAGSYISDNTFISKTIFFMTEDRDRYQSPALISGLKEQLSLYKYDLKVFSTGGCIKGEKEILLSVKRERPAALIIEPFADLVPNPDQRLIEEITALGIPVIFCGSDSGEFHIAPDYAEGGKILTKQLLDSGRKNIACIFRMDSSQGHDSYQGYLDALSDCDAGYDESRCLLLKHGEEKEIISGKGNMLSAFVENNLPGCDAVICQNGMIAHQLVSLLADKNINVPQETSVACFDNGYYSADGILSCGYDNEDFCRALAKTAVALAEGRSAKSVTVRYQYSLESTNS